MFKKKGLAGLAAPGGGVHKVAPISMPAPGEANPGVAEDGSSTGERVGMSAAPRRPRGLGRLGPK